MSQHSQHPLIGSAPIQIGSRLRIEVMNQTANYGDGPTDEGCFVQITVTDGHARLDCHTTELLIGALRGAQRVADEYNDRLAKAGRKKRRP